MCDFVDGFCDLVGIPSVGKSETEAVEAKPAPKPRSAHAERQRRYRERKRDGCDTSRDASSVTGDAAVAASLALQFGCPLEVLRRALLPDAQDRPSTPLGAALDHLAGR